MASPTLPLTKIQAPRQRASLVARTMLEDRMAAAARSKRLVLVAAPAGFGKTAALTRLIGRLAGLASIAWVAVDDDDDPLALLACLCAALEPFDPPWRTDPEALVAMAGGSRADRHAVIGELINALAACEVDRGLIVVDDAHRIRDPAVFEFLDHLLERLPPHWGVVVSTRAEPPLALARLRAHDELAEFRERDLRFALDEVESLLPELPEHIDAAATSRRLLQRTQGWAVGLRLAVNSLAALPASSADSRSGGPAGVADGSTARNVFDYLLAEVLVAMPAELRAFLLRCSVLSELTAARCAAVSGDPRAAERLDEIERRGLFVSALEGHEPTLRLHDLFRDFLKDRLRREMPEELPGLCRRAAAGEADMLRRIGYLLRAGDWDDAEAVLAGAGADIITTVGPAPVVRLLDQFPAELVARSGRLSLLRCQCAWARWDWKRMRDAARQARVAFEAAGDTLSAWRAGFYESISQGDALAKAEDRARRARLPIETLGQDDRALAGLADINDAFDTGRLEEIGPAYARILDALEGSDAGPLWYQCTPRTMQCGLPGMRRPLARFAAGALRVVPETPTPMRAIAWTTQAWGELAAGDVAVAMRTAQLAEADARWLGPPPNVRVFLYGLLSVLHALHGRRDDAYRAVDELKKTFDDPDVGYRRGSLVHLYYRQHQVRVADLLGDADTVRRWAAELPTTPAGPPSEGVRRVLTTQAAAIAGRLAWLAGDAAGATAAFEDALSDGMSLWVYGQAAEIRLRLAQALVHCGRTVEAVQAVVRVVPKPNGTGEPGGALTVGAVLLGELARLDGAGLPAPDAATLRRWASMLPGLAPRTVATAAAMTGAGDPTIDAGALSPRELEVLRQIAAGDSNKLIARAFELSPHTVKRHVANILDKLGLQSRGQAAAWYRAHVR